jgi:hypothetical protein
MCMAAETASWYSSHSPIAASWENPKHQNSVPMVSTYVPARPQQRDQYCSVKMTICVDSLLLGKQWSKGKKLKLIF